MRMKRIILNSLDNSKIGKFEVYVDLLRCWTKRTNLISFEEKELWDEVILDSLVPYFMGFSIFQLDNLEVVDVGTGAGIPGIPIAVVKDGWKFHLIESVKKKVEFLSFVVKRLNLSNVVIHRARVEEFALENRGKFDLVFERAVASTPAMIEYCAPLLEIGGEAFIYGGVKNHLSLEKGKEKVEELGLRIEGVHRYELGENDIKRRCIIHLRKTHETPSTYPRRVGMAVKKPIWR
ncbi:MAG: 16S rRNA (guanine(527)-N(7))-methyltransferase RsmG [Thermotoga sp.]|nr:MAG: 16S rRNA (guanine(527)-N(7))-methyltransferase RsmG [Thermotoga sp.]